MVKKSALLDRVPYRETINDSRIVNNTVLVVDDSYIMCIRRKVPVYGSICRKTESRIDRIYPQTLQHFILKVSAITTGFNIQHFEDTYLLDRFANVIAAQTDVAMRSGLQQQRQLNSPQPPATQLNFTFFSPRSRPLRRPSSTLYDARPSF
jgi:hypothetical protein